MEDDIGSIKGTEYVIDDLGEAFHSPEKFRLDDEIEASIYGIQDDYLRAVITSESSDTMIYTTANNSKYIIHHWNMEEDRGLLEDDEGLKWLHDGEKNLSAYFDGEGYVAAHNPDISRVWEDIINGEWMEDFEDDFTVLDGLNRLHPEIRERVMRGL